MSNNISVIIPTYNRIEFLEKLILILVSYPSILEIIVIDDESTDQTGVTIDELRKKHNKIQYYKNPQKYQAHAKKFGTSIAKGKYLCFLDDDTIPNDNWIERILDCMNNNYEIIQTAILSKKYDEKHISKDIRLQGMILFNAETITRWNYGNTIKTVQLCQECGVLIRRDVLEKVPFFDPNLIGDGNGESISFSIRARNAGYHIYFDPNAILIHYDAKTGGSKTRFGKGKIINGSTIFQKYAFYNRIYLCKRYFKQFLLLSLLYYFCKILLAFVLVRKVNCLIYPMQGIRDALKIKDEKDNSTKGKRIISIVTFVILILILFLYIKYNIDDFRKLQISNPIYFVPLIGISLASSLINGMITKYISEPFKVKLKFHEWFGLSVVTSFYNTITPFKGGTIVKAVYLKSKHGLMYTNYLSAIAGLYVINFFIGSFLGTLSVLAIYFKYNIFNLLILSMFLFFLIPLFMIIVFSPHFPETKNKFINKFIQVINGWNIISRERMTIIKLSAITIIQISINCMLNVISFYIFGIELGFEKALFLSTVNMMGLLVQITPSGFGISETIAVFSGIIVDIVPAQSLSVAVLNRMIGLIPIMVFGPIYTNVLINYKKGKRK